MPGRARPSRRKSAGHVEADHDFGIILLSALRFAMWSRSYLPGIMIDFVKRHWSQLGTQDQAKMIKELREAMQRNEDLGGASIAKRWSEFFEWMAETK